MVYFVKGLEKGEVVLSYAEKIIESIYEEDETKIQELIGLSFTFDTNQEKAELAEWLLLEGFLEEAEKVYSFLSKKTGYHEESLLRLSEIAIEEGKIEMALSYLEMIPKTSSAYPQALMITADLYQTQGLYEISEAKLKEARALLPDEPVLLYALAELYYSIGQSAKALVGYSQLREEGYEEFAGTNILIRLAELNLLNGHFKNAEQQYKELLKKNKSTDLLFQLSLLYMQIEEFENAIIQLESLKETDPFFTSLYPILAEAYEKEGSLNSALRTVEEGISADKTNPALFLLAARLNFKKGNIKEALKYYEKTLFLQPENEKARLELSEIKEKQGDTEDALELLSVEESDPYVIWKKAQIQEELEDYHAAGILYDQVYVLLKNNEEFIKDYLLFLRDEGKFNLAEQIVLEAESQKIFPLETILFLKSLIRYD